VASEIVTRPRRDKAWTSPSNAVLAAGRYPCLAHFFSGTGFPAAASDRKFDVLLVGPDPRQTGSSALAAARRLRVAPAPPADPSVQSRL